MYSIVQYYPFTGYVGRMHVMPTEIDENIRHQFLEEVNASDYEHNSIVFIVKGDARHMDIKKEFETFILVRL